MAIEQTIISTDRTADLRAALRLTYLTLGWMTVEGVSALWLGAVSKSLLLEGFGLDSVLGNVIK